MRNTIPSTRMMTSAAWNADSYSHSLMTAMLATTTAKKLLSPMPGAMTNGLLAKNAMQIVPIAEAMQVARNTPFHSGVPTAKLVSRFGLSAMM